ncbi:MAG: hypothetical protein IPF82_24180 [Blastocatellia bacterium]|nr:hypothetical protein [Blastocatellia bacterium]
MDEFQDTNPVQLRDLPGARGALPCSVWVGDRSRRSSGFRGTDPALMDAAILALLAPTSRRRSRLRIAVEGNWWR